MAVALGLLGSALVAFLLTPAVRRFTAVQFRPEADPGSVPRARSSWLRNQLHVVLAALLGAGAGAVGTSWVHVIALAAAAVGCALLTAVDLAIHRLPRVILLPTYAAVVPLLVAAAAYEHAWESLWRAGYAALALGLVYLLLGALIRTGLGFGDVTFAPLLGLVLGWYGWVPTITGAMAAFVLAALAAIGLLILRRATTKTRIAFGPWMVAGAVAGLALWA